MFYVVPFFGLARALAGRGTAACSPLVFSFWLTGLTRAFVFLVLREGRWGRGILLYLVEERLAC